MGHIARWIASGPRRLLMRHGRVVGSVLAVGFIGIVAAARIVDFDTPALASDLTPGTNRDFDLIADPTQDTQVLLGDWLPDPRGTCRENLERPKPGSEKMGLLQLAPDTVYHTFSAQAQYFEQRPVMTDGSEMDGGIAFGIRDANDFYLLEENALHDVLRLDRFVHGKRRDLHEKLVRTHGNESHTLDLSVAADSVSAGLDGQTFYTVANVPETAGGIGVWARTAAATCFGDLKVEVS
jgi:hypothetical protein